MRAATLMYTTLQSVSQAVLLKELSAAIAVNIAVNHLCLSERLVWTYVEVHVRPAPLRAGTCCPHI